MLARDVYKRQTPTPPLPPPRSAVIPLSNEKESNLALGDAAFARGDLSEARKHYDDARAADPRGVAPLVGLARVRIALVDVPLDYAAAKGNREIIAAEKDLARAVKAGPSFGPAFIELGRARLLLGDAPQAIDALKRGVEMLADEPEARSQFGIALLATGHAEEAVRELARAVELDPGSPARHGNLGTALMMAGRTKEAIDEYRARTHVDDGDARAHSDLGTALLGSQDLQGALAELARAVQIDPRRAAFHSNLGYALQQSGRVDRAIGEYREALRLDPAFASGWINLATALARDPKSRGEARASLERARALSPDDPRVKANLEAVSYTHLGLVPFAPLLGLLGKVGALRTVAEVAMRPLGEWDVLVSVGLHRWLLLASALPAFALALLGFGHGKLRPFIGGLALGTGALLVQMVCLSDVAFVGCLLYTSRASRTATSSRAT